MGLEGEELLAELCTAPGISGHESAVAEIIRNHLQRLGLEASVDRLGNVTARVEGAPPRALLFAHMDEVGFVVRKISADGFLAIERVGGASTHALPGQRLNIWTETGAVTGVAGVLPQHLAGDAAPPDLTTAYVDIGASSREQAHRRGVEVGSPITFHGSFKQLDGRVSAKALDDRLGCFLLLRLAESLRANPPQCEVHLAFVVQEETRLHGAMPLAFGRDLDWALGVDATLAFDTPDLMNGQTDVRLGGGPAIKVMDHVRRHGQGFIAHLGLRTHIEAAARERAIAAQREVVIGLTTAAAPLPFVRAGLPVAAVSFPLRYSHSPVEVADVGDIQATLQLLQAVVDNPWKN